MIEQLAQRHLYGQEVLSINNADPMLLSYP